MPIYDVHFGADFRAYATASVEAEDQQAALAKAMADFRDDNKRWGMDLQWQDEDFQFPLNPSILDVRDEDSEIIIEGPVDFAMDGDEVRRNAADKLLAALEKLMLKWGDFAYMAAERDGKGSPYYLQILEYKALAENAIAEATKAPGPTV